MRNGSAVAEILRTVNPRLRDQFGISDNVITVVEIVVIVVRRLLDDSDPRPLESRLDDIGDMLPSFDTNAFEDKLRALAKVQEKDVTRWITRWAKRFTSPNRLLFARRIMGAALYDKLAAAVREDGALVVVGLRRASRSLMPTALALDDCAATLSAEQLREVGGYEQIENSMLSLALRLDSIYDKLLDMDLPLDGVPIRPEEQRALQVDLSTLANQLRAIVATGSEERIAELNDALAKKISGAQDALLHSADGVSQAANSLIEFIDRLLRKAFTETYVLEWVASYYPDPKFELTFLDKNQNRVRPTKRGQALCFAHGGEPAQNQSPLHRVAAAGIAEGRQQLQKLKHADVGGTEEVEQMQELLRAVEGFFLFAIRVGWAGVEDTRFQELKTRLAA
jgi:hypothetical protein